MPNVQHLISEQTIFFPCALLFPRADHESRLNICFNTANAAKDLFAWEINLATEPQNIPFIVPFSVSIQKGITIATLLPETPSLDFAQRRQRGSKLSLPYSFPISHQQCRMNSWKCHASESSAELWPTTVWNSTFTLRLYGIDGPHQKAWAAVWSEKRETRYKELKWFPCSHHGL